MDPEKIIREIEKSKEKHTQEVNEQMHDRIKYGAKETLDYFSRKMNQGYRSDEILKDIEKSKYK